MELRACYRPPCRNGHADAGLLDTDWHWRVSLPLAPLLDLLPTWRRDDGE